MIRAAVPADADAVAGLINAINSLDGLPPAGPMTPDVVRRDLGGEILDGPALDRLAAETG